MTMSVFGLFSICLLLGWLLCPLSFLHLQLVGRPSRCEHLFPLILLLYLLKPITEFFWGSEKGRERQRDGERGRGRSRDRGW